jgi:hypothetical protein
MCDVFFQLRVVISSMVLASVAATLGSAQDQAAERVLREARVAVGGKNVHYVTTFSAEGRYRRVLPAGTAEGDLELRIAFPGRYQRVEGTAMGSGSRRLRFVMTLNESVGWSALLGALPPAMNVNVHSINGDDPQKKQAGGLPASDPTPAIRNEFRRISLALFAGVGAPARLAYSHAGRMKSPRGQADVIDVAGDDGFRARLFVDVKTHLPALLKYADRDSTQVARRPPSSSVSGPEGDRHPRRSGNGDGPPIVEHTWSMAEYKTVGGLLLPHRMLLHAGGTLVQEWELRSVQVNVPIDIAQFTKK